ncbi:MAG TPA: ABC transporter substrate-binding protein [Solirubrobacterales bacterium]|nr:ABC transporter substrate-binding protein [Solirubrobacterales bacterium]
MLGLALLFSACGGGGSDGGGEDSVTLGMTSDLFPALKAPIARWGKEHGVKVTIREMPADTGAYFDQMRTMLQAGSGEVDLFAGDVSWPAQFGSNGWLADVSAAFTPAERKAYFPAFVQANEWEGKLYGFPFFTDVGLLYYRKDLLAKAGFTKPPETWDELKEMAKTVMAEDPTIEDGFTFTGARYEGGTLLGTEFIETSGGSVIDGEAVEVDQPPAVEGLETQRSMVTSGVSPAAVANYEEGDAEAPFLAGRSVFLRNWAYVFGDIANPELSEIKPSQVGVTSVPRASTQIPPVNVGGGWNLYVNAYSSNQQVAIELAKFISSEAQQKHTAETIGYLPTRKAVYNDQSLIESQPAIAQGKTEISQTVTPPKSPYYADMSAVMAEQFNKSLSGASSPADAAEAVQSGLESIINRGG